MHHVKDIEQLSLVLVKPLDLHVKYGIRINRDAIMLLDIFCQTHFVLALDLHKFFLRCRIVRIFCDAVDHRQIHDPVLAHLLCHPVCKQRVGMKQETPLCDTVCLVVELPREHLVEVLQFLILEDLCVEPCHTVHAVAGNDRHMRHLHLAVRDDRHLLDLVGGLGISVHDVQQEPAVDLLHDLVDPREQSLEQVYRPLFQRLCHDRVIGVRAGLCRDLPRLIPLQAVIIEQNPHQLGDRHCRVCIIQLESNFLVKFVNVVMS